MILNRSKYVHLLIMFVLAFGISVLPPFGQVTVFGMVRLCKDNIEVLKDSSQ